MSHDVNSWRDVDVVRNFNVVVLLVRPVISVMAVLRHASTNM